MSQSPFPPPSPSSLGKDFTLQIPLTNWLSFRKKMVTRQTIFIIDDSLAGRKLYDHFSIVPGIRVKYLQLSPDNIIQKRTLYDCRQYRTIYNVCNMLEKNDIILFLVCASIYKPHSRDFDNPYAPISAYLTHLFFNFLREVFNDKRVTLIVHPPFDLGYEFEFSQLIFNQGRQKFDMVKQIAVAYFPNLQIVTFEQFLEMHKNAHPHDSIEPIRVGPEMSQFFNIISSRERESLRFNSFVRFFLASWETKGWYTNNLNEDTSSGCSTPPPPYENQTEIEAILRIPENIQTSAPNSNEENIIHSANHYSVTIINEAAES